MPTEAITAAISPPSRLGPSAIQAAFSAWATPHRVSAWVRAALLGAFQMRSPESVSAMNNGGHAAAKSLLGGFGSGRNGSS